MNSTYVIAGIFCLVFQVFTYRAQSETFSYSNREMNDRDAVAQELANRDLSVLAANRLLDHIASSEHPELYHEAIFEALFNREHDIIVKAERLLNFDRLTPSQINRLVTENLH